MCKTIISDNHYIFNAFGDWLKNLTVIFRLMYGSNTDKIEIYNLIITKILITHYTPIIFNSYKNHPVLYAK